MSGDVLSQLEVENLLSAMNSGGPADQQAPAAEFRGAARTPLMYRDKIVNYDFKRPERVGKEQMRALHTMHEGFGRKFGGGIFPHFCEPSSK